MTEDREAGISADAVSAVWILEVETEQRHQLGESVRFGHRRPAERLGDAIDVVVGRAEIVVRLERRKKRLEGVGREGRRVDRRRRAARRKIADDRSSASREGDGRQGPEREQAPHRP